MKWILLVGCLLLVGCKCTTVSIYVEKDWKLERDFDAPDTHTKMSINFDGEKWSTK